MRPKKKFDIVEIFSTPQQITTAANRLGVSFETVADRLRNLPPGYRLERRRIGTHVFYSVAKSNQKARFGYAEFQEAMLARGIVFEAEYRFHKSRKWRFDFANVEKRIAVEVEGGVWIGGRHTRSAGFFRDIEKYNTAALLGWRVIRTTPQHVLSKDFQNFVAEFFEDED